MTAPTNWWPLLVAACVPAAPVVSDFDRALPHVLQYEGGWYPGGPGDPNPTMRGVTQRTYDAYRAAKGLPRMTVRQIDDRELADLYFTRYWTPAGCDSLDWGLCLVVFDLAVNSGVGRAKRMLAETGPDVMALLDAREAFYRRLAVAKPDSARFLRGWLRRVEALREVVADDGS